VRSQGKARQGFEARALCALESDRSLYSNSAVVNKQLLGKCHLDKKQASAEVKQKNEIYIVTRLAESIEERE
jgi:hypothetical protein